MNYLTLTLIVLIIPATLSVTPTSSAPTDTTTIPPTYELGNQENLLDSPSHNNVTSANKKEETPSNELPDVTSYMNTSTFTCHGKITGYYADVRLGCRVYHFCTQLESFDGASYQRMSYICMEGSLFDQKDLNCVKEADLKVPCDQAEAEYESSNKQFDSKSESQPSMTDSLAANIMMNPITRFIAGR